MTTTQVIVLNALTEGCSITDAPGAANVDRSRLHKWLQSDYAFMAAHNRAKRQLVEETGSGLQRWLCAQRVRSRRAYPLATFRPRSPFSWPRPSAWKHLADWLR